MNKRQRIRSRTQLAAFIPGVERLESRLALSTFGGGFEPRHSFGGHDDFGFRPDRHDGFRQPRPEEFRFESGLRRPPPPPNTVQHVAVVTPTVSTNAPSPPPATTVQSQTTRASALPPQSALPVITTDISNLARAAATFRPDRSFETSAVSVKALESWLVTASDAFLAELDSADGEDTGTLGVSEKSQADKSARNLESERADSGGEQLGELDQQRRRSKHPLADDEGTPQDGWIEIYATGDRLPTSADESAQPDDAALTSGRFAGTALDWLSLQVTAVQPTDGTSLASQARLIPDELIHLLALDAICGNPNPAEISMAGDGLSLSHATEIVFEPLVGRLATMEILQFDDSPIADLPVEFSPSAVAVVTPPVSAERGTTE